MQLCYCAILLRPNLILLQEHWLTPANLFDSHFVDHISFGSSAMSEVETGMLRGRPFGGVVILVKSSVKEFSPKILQLYII